MSVENLTFEQALEGYGEFIKADYDRMDSSNGNYKYSFEPGNKFIKVIKESWGSKSVHSFIVKADCKAAKGMALKAGDVLKAASYKAPAMNFIRGNIFDGSYVNRARWTGVL